MNKNKQTTSQHVRFLAVTGLIAGLYAALTLVLAPLSFGPVQCRVAEALTILADGRLAWRVLSNLLSNAVKYALPGTRLYIDLAQLDGKVLISLKNISRE